MEREERWEAPGHFQGVLPQNWGGNESKIVRSPVCAQSYGLRQVYNSGLFHNEFRGPRSDIVRQVQNVKLDGHQTCLSINRLWHELCDMLRRLVGTTAPGHHDCSIQE
ncbi:hypothetical protein TNCV_1316741 [Trichonephila clavipes]|nr:hypothetical protein TNCV_1316741 [Trichonephila clavipes]